MKRMLRLLVVFGSGLLMIGCAGMAQEVKKQAMSFVVTTPMVELSKNSKVLLYGMGFTPKEEVTLLFADAAGGLSVISGAVKPAPVPNKEGAWVAEWELGDYATIIKPGTAVISVVDQQYKTLAQVPVLFVAPPKKPEPKKDAPKK
jgi:hypothetical protein